MSRFVDEDAHFEEVPGCPLRGARAGAATAHVDESACSACRYNVAFPREPTIGCVVRTPPSVVQAALARVAPPLADELRALRAAGPVADTAMRRRWAQLGERWLAQSGPEDDAGRELAGVMLRFAAETTPDVVEILR